MSDNILDSLDIKDNALIKDILNGEEDSIMNLPNLCVSCPNSIICSILPTLLGINRIGIILELKSCRFKPVSQSKK